MNDKRAAMVMGGLVADAGALGLHWLYDPGRLTQLDAEGDIVFLEPDATNYENAKGVFVHHGKVAGQLSHYGHVARLALKTLSVGEDARFYQNCFVEHFGLGGAYKGYIDKPMRGMLGRVESSGDDVPLVSGIDDDQMLAFSPVASVIAAGDNDEVVDDFVRVTNENDDARNGALVVAQVLKSLMNGADMTAALTAGMERADDELARQLEQVMRDEEKDVAKLATVYGRACHVPMGLALGFALLKNAGSFSEGVHNNILAGGDSCGRAMFIGPALGAYFGLCGERGIPLEWILKLEGADVTYAQVKRFDH